MQVQSVPWFQIFLIAFGLVFRAYAGRKRDYISKINSSISSLRDEARHEMLLTLGQLFHDVESQKGEQSEVTPDGGEEETPSGDDPSEPTTSVFEKWANNPTVEDEVRLAILRVTRTIQEKAEAGDPKEESLKQLQEIRRKMQPGADLETVQRYRQLTERAEKYLQQSLNAMVLFGVVVSITLILPASGPGLSLLEYVTSFLVTYGPVIGSFTLLVTMCLVFVSHHYRSKAKTVFERNGINADGIDGFL